MCTGHVHREATYQGVHGRHTYQGVPGGIYPGIPTKEAYTQVYPPGRHTRLYSVIHREAYQAIPRYTHTGRLRREALPPPGERERVLKTGSGPSGEREGGLCAEVSPSLLRELGSPWAQSGPILPVSLLVDVSAGV